jgi:hypothetical protein
MKVTPVLAAAFTAAAVRQGFILHGILTSRRFLLTAQSVSADRPDPPLQDGLAGGAPIFFIVVPVLREAAVLPAAIAHLRQIAAACSATVIVVTSEREHAERALHPGVGDTVAVARQLAGEGLCIHAHFPDPAGVKADQLNYAATICSDLLPPNVPASSAFLVCYDADSRPPEDSLVKFADAIRKNSTVDVFHQSSRFELRSTGRPGRGALAAVERVVCGSGALRANRFVLGFELPRLLNQSPLVSARKRAFCSGVYTHITGHGLCLRLPLVQQVPFPCRSPLEDMHYSFVLGSRGMALSPMTTLDVAEVPDSATAQFRQAARWFAGPGRFARYLKDPAVTGGWGTRLLAISAAGSAAEWIGCALVPPLAVATLVAGHAPARRAAATFAALCGVQAVLTELWLGSPDPLRVRIIRVLGLPAACVVHGAGGIAGARHLLTGGSGAGKTER